MGTNLFDFGNPFAREAWASILPFTFVVLFCAPLIPRVRSVWQRVFRPFRNSLTLEQVEAYEAAHGNENGTPADHSTPIKSITSTSRTVAISGLALLQALVWLGLGLYSFTVYTKVWDGILPVITAMT